MKDPRDVILAPVVSEKSYDAIEVGNVYTFIVDRRVVVDEAEQLQGLADLVVGLPARCEIGRAHV